MQQLVFHIVIPWITIVLAFLVLWLFIHIDRCQQKLRARFDDAMTFALELPIYDGRQFMRAFLAGNDAELRTHFPTWEQR